MNFAGLTTHHLTLKKGSKEISKQGPCVMVVQGELYQLTLIYFVWKEEDKAPPLSPLLNEDGL